jgi:hypothetical protein
MKIRRSTKILGSIGLTLLAVVIFVFIWFWPRPESLYGTWLSTKAYQGNPSGSISFVFEPEDQVRVIADGTSPPWWAAKDCELKVRGNSIEIWSGQQQRGELIFKKWGRSIALLDRSSPTSTLSLRKR